MDSDSQKDRLLSRLRRCRPMASRYDENDSDALRNTWMKGIDLMLTVAVNADKQQSRQALNHYKLMRSENKVKENNNLHRGRNFAFRMTGFLFCEAVENFVELMITISEENDELIDELHEYIQMLEQRGNQSRYIIPRSEEFATDDNAGANDKSAPPSPTIKEEPLDNDGFWNGELEEVKQEEIDPMEGTSSGINDKSAMVPNKTVPGPTLKRLSSQLTFRGDDVKYACSPSAKVPERQCSTDAKRTRLTGVIRDHQFELFRDNLRKATTTAVTAATDTRTVGEVCSDWATKFAPVPLSVGPSASSPRDEVSKDSAKQGPQHAAATATAVTSTSFTCKHCGMLYLSKGHLDRHKYKCTEYIAAKQQQRIFCRLCGIVAMSAWGLKIHVMKSHTTAEYKAAFPEGFDMKNLNSKSRRRQDQFEVIQNRDGLAKSSGGVKGARRDVVPSTLETAGEIKEEEE
ncbi:hypothetical protein PMAYCL1PPCAC_14126 [Pristionchus mayeri]|uniref:Uncharacterized protein n=1 Tax=Pristionchus mayeri TaxID=1317129 RepID=A0AAN4ZRT8_9BILA|nr:hypothetical protein PMAYCL1PPCAC_14126 [Pristionchus mayeri]